MRRLWILCVLLLGCGSAAELPTFATFDGVCVSDGVRIDVAGSTPYRLEQAGEILIRNGALVTETCQVPIVGFNGADFDLSPASCDLEPGVVMFIDDGTGTLRDGRLDFEVRATVDSIEEGVTFEFTTTCEATERP